MDHEADPLHAAEVDLVRAALAAVIAPLALVFVASVAVAPTASWVPGAMLAAGLVVALVVNLGNHRAGGLLLCVLLGGVLVIAAHFYGGLRGTTIQVLPFVVLVAALTLGPRAGWLAAAATTGVVASFFAFEQGLGWAPIGWPTPVEHLVTSIGVSLSVAGLTTLKVWRLREALRASQASQAALRRELQLRTDAQERLSQAMAEAMSASQAKTEFLANMSHELRTPLNAVIGYSEILLEDAEEDTASDLNRIRTAGRHLLSLINDVLDLAKIEAGRMLIVDEEVDVGAMLAELVETVRPLVERGHNEIVTDWPSDLEPIRTDGTRVRQVLLNLLSNAAKFTEQGLVTLRVRPDVVAREEVLRFEVSDTGIGIPDDVLPRLFRPFVQGDASTRRRFGGTGLGLVLCSRFAALLEGAIEVQTVEGEGSTFTFTIPRASARARASALTERRVAEAPVSPHPVVLCVDDEPGTAELLDRVVASGDLHPVPVTDPRRVLDLARKLRPSAITLDVHMPGLDGWAVLDQLEADPVLRHVPVVMVSVDDASSHPRAVAAASCLPKPIDRGRLLATLAGLVRPDGPVLVVEDDEPTRLLLRRLLEREGLEVVEAVDGADGLRVLERVVPSVVLLDLMMPELDGFGFAEVVRRKPELDDLPIVVLTAATLGSEEQQRLSGCKSVLRKEPDTMASLVAELHRVVAARVTPLAMRRRGAA